MEKYVSYRLLDFEHFYFVCFLLFSVVLLSFFTKITHDSTLLLVVKVRNPFCTNVVKNEEFLYHIILIVQGIIISSQWHGKQREDTNPQSNNNNNSNSNRECECNNKNNNSSKNIR